MPRATVEDLVVLVLRDYQVNGKKSKRSVELHSRPLLRFFNGKIPTSSQVEEYKAARIEKGIKPATISNELSILRRGITLGERYGLVKPHEVPVIESPKIRNVRTIFPTVQQIQTIVKVLDTIEPDVADYVRWRVFTGWRHKETSWLTWDHVTADRRAVQLAQENSKTGKPRFIQLGRHAAALVDKRHRRRFLEFVFHRGGKRIYTFRGPWRRAVAAAGIPELRPHDLRRFFAQQGVSAGVPRHVLMDIAGWKSASMFERYAIVDQTQQAEGQDRLAERIF